MPGRGGTEILFPAGILKTNMDHYFFKYYRSEWMEQIRQLMSRPVSRRRNVFLLVP